MVSDSLNIKKFRFREFSIYKDSRIFRVELRLILKQKFPKDEQYGLTSQTHRALDSIILNIAEGTDRGTDKDFAHFLNNSHTSLNEVIACLDLAFDSKYIDTETHHTYLRKAENLADQLTAFRKKLLYFPTK